MFSVALFGACLFRNKVPKYGTACGASHFASFVQYAPQIICWFVSSSYAYARRRREMSQPGPNKRPCPAG